MAPSFYTKSCYLILFVFVSFSVSSVSAQSNTCPDTEASCEGHKLFDNGNIYDGELAYGTPNGEGLMKFATGNEYLGDFKNGKPHGSGVMLLSNGDSYRGAWKDGEADGQGVYKKSTGGSFSGNFAKGMRQGEGFITTTDGDSLIGTWIEDRMEGLATFVFSNGDKLITRWMDGNMKVNAAYITEEGKKIKGSLSNIYIVLTTMESSFQEDIDMAISNIQMAWMSAAMEFKATQDFDLAMDFLTAAQKYGPTNDDRQTAIASQINDIDNRQNNTGWAQLPKEK